MSLRLEGDWLVIRPDPPRVPERPRACEHVRLVWWLTWAVASLAMWAGIGLAAWAVVAAIKGG